MTAAQLARKLQALGAAVPTEFRKTSNGIAVSSVRFTRERMTEQIYSVPEDRSGTGRKKWRRTGNLRRSEQAEVVDPYTVRVFNSADYAEPRHEAGKPGRRIINPLRESHWRDDLLETFRPVLLDAYRETVLDLLKGRRR